MDSPEDTSTSGLWALVAPVLVPMLILVEIRPGVTIALYRIGDSVTNVISPMSPYFAISPSVSSNATTKPSSR